MTFLDSSSTWIWIELKIELYILSTNSSSSSSFIKLNWGSTRLGQNSIRFDSFAPLISTTRPPHLILSLFLQPRFDLLAQVSKEKEKPSFSVFVCFNHHLLSFSSPKNIFLYDDGRWVLAVPCYYIWDIWVLGCISGESTIMLT